MNCLTEEGDRLTSCMNCGAYDGRRNRLLKRPCKAEDQPDNIAKGQLYRVLKGLHPQERDSYTTTAKNSTQDLKALV
eukprot:1524883-Amphidinium_carterae.1